MNHCFDSTSAPLEQDAQHLTGLKQTADPFVSMGVFTQHASSVKELARNSTGFFFFNFFFFFLIFFFLHFFFCHFFFLLFFFVIFFLFFFFSFFPLNNLQHDASFRFHFPQSLLFRVVTLTQRKTQLQQNADSRNVPLRLRPHYAITT